MQLLYIPVEWTNREIFPALPVYRLVHLLKHVSTQTYVKGLFFSAAFFGFSPSSSDKSQLRPMAQCIPLNPCSVSWLQHCVCTGQNRSSSAFVEQVHRDQHVCMCLQWTAMIIPARHLRYAGARACLVTSASLFPLPLPLQERKQRVVQIDECEAALYKPVVFSWGECLEAGTTHLL